MKKSIGIIGGMGPLATADLFYKIVKKTKAQNDQEHIRIYIDNNTTISDRTAAILNAGPDPVPAMTESIRKLEACGADCLIMPCNTAHYFLPRLQKVTKLPFVSILEATASACVERYPGKTAGLLATRGTLESHLYDQALETKKVPCLLPSEENKSRLMKIIYQGVKKGASMERVCPLMEKVLAEMLADGADYFILGCTELPIVFDRLSTPPFSVDPTEELAKAAIRFCGYEIQE